MTPTSLDHPLPRPVQWIDQLMLDQISEQARLAPRQRINHNLHAYEDRVQRMINALEPATYVRPHRHQQPPKNEIFVILRGKVAALFFDESGTITQCIHLSPERTCIVDIPVGVYHSLVAFEPGTVVFEAKDGPYLASNDKDFAPWAPTEADPKAEAYREQLRRAAVNFRQTAAD